MNWLRKIELATLAQSSDVPYVILPDGVHLCFDNLYFESTDASDHHIRFTAHKGNLIRSSANCYRFKKFPVVIPFKDVISLDDSIVNGRIIKTASEPTSDSKNIIVIRSKILSQLEEEEFQEVVDSIDNYDAAFLLTGREIGPYDRLLEDSVEIIQHRGWHHSCVAIAHHVCEGKNRKYCWTQHLPGLSITIYGIQNVDDLDTISQCFEDIGVIDKEIIWG